MKSILNQFTSQIAKNATNSICGNLMADINTVIQMADMLDSKTKSVFFTRVVSEFQQLVTGFTKEFADYVTEQDSQEVSNTKTE